MMGYDFEVSYRKGAYNTVADALSIRPDNEAGQLMAISSFSTDLLYKIKESWKTDADVCKLIAKLETTVPNTTKYLWHKGELRRKGKLLMRKNAALRKELLDYFHNSPTKGHSGVSLTVNRITSGFYLKEMKKEVQW